jgi:hypothetical protein
LCDRKELYVRFVYECVWKNYVWRSCVW